MNRAPTFSRMDCCQYDHHAHDVDPIAVMQRPASIDLVLHDNYAFHVNAKPHEASARSFEVRTIEPQIQLLCAQLIKTD